jgi:hypothetical protein
MNLFRTLGAVAVVALGWAGTSSCLTPPDFPATPTITFNQINSIYEPPSAESSGGGDTIEFVINFQDGDGDLGLDADEATVAPYSDPTGGHNNLSKANNFFIQAYKYNKSTREFAPFYTPNSGFPGENDSRYPRLETNRDAKPAPLKGTIRYKLRLRLSSTSYAIGDVLKFDIGIMDRAFHVSNIVTTTPVTLGP